MTIKDINNMNLDILVVKYKKALFQTFYIERGIANYMKHNFNDIDTTNYLDNLKNKTHDEFISYLSQR